MADERTDQNEMTDTETDTETTESEDVDVDAVASQATNPDAVRRALHAEREAAKKARKEVDALAARLKEFEDRDKTEQEKLAEERDDLKARLTPLEAENLRLRVAMEKKLPGELIDRLQGTDREEMEADADKLLALVAKTAGARGSADQGARGGGARQLTDGDLKTMSPEQIDKARKDGKLDALLGIS